MTSADWARACDLAVLAWVAIELVYTWAYLGREQAHRHLMWVGCGIQQVSIVLAVLSGLLGLHVGHWALYGLIIGAVCLAAGFRRERAAQRERRG